MGSLENHGDDERAEERRPGARPVQPGRSRRVSGGTSAVNPQSPEEPNAALDTAMARVGDRWTLLVIDALLDRSMRFSELEEAIPGLAPNVLTARLRRLESQGLVTSVRYSERPPRHEYRATESGRDLAGALRMLARWGARASGGDVQGPRHRACGTPLEARWFCPTCERVTEDADDDNVRWV